MQGLFVVRQPVYTRTQHVFGYKIQFQSYPELEIEPDTEADAARRILDAIIEIGFDSLVGHRNALIAMPRPLLCGGCELPFPKDRTIIELVDYQQADECLFEAVTRLVSEGHSIALADFELTEQASPLLEFVQIVKLRVEEMDERQLSRQVRALKRFDNLKLLAAGVQSQEKYEFCRGLGMNYFEGNFFARPKIVKRKRLPTNKMVVMQLLAALQRSNILVPQLEALISKDVALSYKLLRYINSAFFGLPRPVESIQRAIIFLGTKAIQKWASLLALARFDEKPTELMVTAVVRGRMCELLAAALGYEDGDVFFTAGLLSVLDALLDLPMSDVLKHLTLSDELNRALLKREGRVGRVLHSVLSYESQQWDDVPLDGLSCHEIKDAYIESLAWAGGASRMLRVE